MLKSGLAEERREEDGLWCVVLVYQDTQTVFNLYFECFKSFTSCLHFLLIKQITKELQQIRKFSILMVGTSESRYYKSYLCEPSMESLHAD